MGQGGKQDIETSEHCRPPAFLPILIEAILVSDKAILVSDKALLVNDKAILFSTSVVNDEVTSARGT